MKYFGENLGEKHKELSSIIRREEMFDRARELFLEIHAALHLSEATGTKRNEVDSLIEDLQDWEYTIMPTARDETIAWALWHMARIEDLTMNYLVAGREQVFNEAWRKKIKVGITDTGNALTDEEIIALSSRINIGELLNYRSKVAERTRKIAAGLKAEDMKRKVRPADLDKILLNGGVTKHQDSIWLLDFWGRKNVAGILLMPATRHEMLHLNDCCKWKEHIRSKKSYDKKRNCEPGEIK